MDERIKKQRLSRRDFSNFPSIISRVIREIKYVFRILKRTKKYSVFFTSNDPPDSRRIRSEFPLKFRGYIEIEVEWCPGYYANGAAETVTAKKRDGVGKQVSKDGFSWFPRKLRVKSCFAGIYSRERSKCLGGERQSVRVTGSRFVNFFISSFHYFIGVVPRYHIFVDRGETNGRTIMRPWNWSTRRVCARAQNLIALTSEQRAIWPILYIYNMSVCVRTCTPHNFDYTCNPVVLIHKFHIRERNDVNTRSNDRFVNPPSFIGSSTRYFFLFLFLFLGEGRWFSSIVFAWMVESERKRFIGEFQRYQQCE